MATTCLDCTNGCFLKVLDTVGTEDQYELEINVENIDNSTSTEEKVSDNNKIALYLIIISIVMLVVMLNILSPCTMLSRTPVDESTGQAETV